MKDNILLIWKMREFSQTQVMALQKNEWRRSFRLHGGGQ